MAHSTRRYTFSKPSIPPVQSSRFPILPLEESYQPFLSQTYPHATVIFGSISVLLCQCSLSLFDCPVTAIVDIKLSLSDRRLMACSIDHEDEGTDHGGSTMKEIKQNQAKVWGSQLNSNGPRNIGDNALKTCTSTVRPPLQSIRDPKNRPASYIQGRRAFLKVKA
ncbi:hypothetical protein BC827DRAFT_260860 [Russula dissimulans]|nr:hypothetical protein BC827DRAFT_260860 [Russula dissimulans]